MQVPTEYATQWMKKTHIKASPCGISHQDKEEVLKFIIRGLGGNRSQRTKAWNVFEMSLIPQQQHWKLRTLEKNLQILRGNDFQPRILHLPNDELCTYESRTNIFIYTKSETTYLLTHFLKKAPERCALPKWRNKLRKGDGIGFRKMEANTGETQKQSPG